MPDYAKKIVYLSEAQYQELITNQTITVNGTTINYDANTIYMTPQNTPLYATDLADWAKAANKPTYTAQEVGALSSSTKIPTKVSDLTNDAGYLTSHQDISGKANSADLAAVATSGDYDDLINKPTIPTIPVQSVNGQTGAVVLDAQDVGSVSKESLDNAGITSKTYSTKFDGEFNVTTVTTSGWLNPYARASVTGRINKENMHRVTFNGTEYILRTRLWYNIDNNLKVYEYLGNLGLYIGSTAGVPGGTDNVPFIIISDLNNNSSIDVITQTAGTYTILVEQINPTKVDLPKSLIWEDSYVPIEKNNNGGTYNGFSFGVNELNNKRGTFAFGYGNKIENEFTNIIGTGNNSSSANSLIYGKNNTITAAGGIAIGLRNSVSGNSAMAIGYGNTANGSDMVAIGKFNTPAITNFPMWQNNTQYKKGDIFQAYPMPNVLLTFLCIEDYLSASSGSFMNDSNASQCTIIAPSSGDTLFVVGNGSSSRSSNALKIDLVGNEYINGDLYVNCDSDSTNGIKVATVNDILVNDVQVEGTSIVSNGIANIPIASSSNVGVVKTDAWFGTAITNEKIYINGASSSDIKTASQLYKPITPYYQHESTFYGLAKAAGDTTQSQSNNAVGIYTDDAKASIRTMLGAGTYSKPVAGIPTSDLASGVVPVQDVQVNGTSILTNGVANVPIASSSVLGVVSISTSDGLFVNASGALGVASAPSGTIKSGPNGSNYRPITPYHQHESVFYGLANAAGDTTQNVSNNAVGTYTDEAKSAIQIMLGIDLSSIASQVEIPLVETVTGAAVTITGQPNTRYMCGEVTSISITPPAAGSIDVVFTSGSTVAVLTLPSTVKMPEWFDATTLDTDTVYEILITDGVYGSVMTWAV